MRGNTLKQIFNVAVIVLVSALGLTLGRLQVVQAWPTDPSARAAGYMMIAALLFWILIWLLWDSFETRGEPPWLGSVVPTTTAIQALIGAGLAVLISILFSMMFLMIGKVHVVILIFSLVVLGETIGDSMVISGLRRRVPSLEPTNAIARYYFQRPHLVLHGIQLCLCVAAAVAYHSMSRHSSTSAVWVGYGILSASVAINEIIINYWRFVRLARWETPQRAEES